MIHPERNMAMVLAISTVFIVFNIIAVTQGTVEFFYSEIEQFVISLLPQF